MKIEKIGYVPFSSTDDTVINDGIRKRNGSDKNT